MKGLDDALQKKDQEMKEEEARKKIAHENKFKLFNIVDMGKMDPDRVCFACMKGFNCPRH